MTAHVVVIGGGPAGTSAAIGFVRRGIGVTLFEQRDRWMGRVCGSFLSPEAVRHLSWLDVSKEILASGAVPVESTIVTIPNGYEAPVQMVHSERSGMALPRKQLEEILLQKAVDEGVDLRMGHRVTAVYPSDDGFRVRTRAAGRLLEEERQTDLVVFADGRFSLGKNKKLQTSDGWYGWNATFEGIRRKPGEQSLHFSAGSYVGVLPFVDGTTNVCGLVKRSAVETLSWDQVFINIARPHRGLMKLLQGSRRVSEWKGVGPLPFSTRISKRPGCLFVGDAAAVGDPFMGEGIGRALSAGPLIWKLLATTSVKSPEFVRRYEVLWKASYNRRLRIGHWSRQAIGNRWAFSLASKAISRPALLNALTPQIHI